MSHTSTPACLVAKGVVCASLLLVLRAQAGVLAPQVDRLWDLPLPALRAGLRICTGLKPCVTDATCSSECKMATNFTVARHTLPRTLRSLLRHSISMKGYSTPRGTGHGCARAWRLRSSGDRTLCDYFTRYYSTQK